MDVVRRPITARIAPPGSKSITNRALVLASMAEGTSILENILLADDTRVMLDSLARLGYPVHLDEPARRLTITGGPVPSRSAELFCGNSGTTLRFLAAAVARGRGEYTLDGVPRMRQRPLGELGEMLRNLGVRISYPLTHGFPPVTIHANALPGGNLRFGSAQSSQYLSAVLMVAPHGRHELWVNLEGKQTSWPYVAMTLRMMDAFGHTPELERDPDTAEPSRIVVPQGSYQPQHYHIEPDASNAGYFLALAALHPGSAVTVTGLSRTSLQGDIALADLLADMGAAVTFHRDAIEVRGTDRLSGIDADVSATPDLAQTLAVVAAYAKGPTTLRGLRTLRVKETDRVAALHTELTKLGAHVAIDDNESDLAMTINPAGKLLPCAIDTYDDHRMAMSFALAATRTEGIAINNPDCCGKTYPEYFTDLNNVLGLESA
jgi:3-phosphoshikimate 1-carboxyvinyltransferase